MADRLIAGVPELQAYLRSGDAGVGVAGARATDATFLTSLLAGATLRAERYAAREFLPDPPAATDLPVTRSVHPDGAPQFAVPDVREALRVFVTGYGDPVELTAGQYRLIARPGEPAARMRIAGAWGDVTIEGRFGFAEPPADVRLAVLAMAARAFHDAQARLGDRVADPDGGVTTYFRQLPVEAKGTLDSYRWPGI